MAVTAVAASNGFARAGVGRGLPAFLARYPHARLERLLERTGLKAQQLGDQGTLVSFPMWIAFQEMVAAETRDCTAVLSYSAQLPWRDLGVLGYVIVNSPTVGAALGNAARYLALQQNVARSSMEVDGSAARMVYGLSHPAIPCHAQNSEGAVTMAVRICREASGDPSWAPREVLFKHERPVSTEAHARVFRCPIRFGQSVDGFVLSAKDLRIPIRGADDTLLQILLRHADEALAGVVPEQDFTDEVTRVVLTSLDSGDVTIDYVAVRLGTSPRTIQRRLRDAGLSFKDVVARARLALSQRYLSDASLTLTETALRLGYSDLSAFSRAFRRWTGRSALAFRRDHQRDS